MKEIEEEERRKGHFSQDSVDGESKQKSKALLQNENLFFFTDQEYFESSRYEYIGQTTPTKGFIFGLFLPQSFSSAGGSSNMTPANTFSSFSNNQSTLNEIERMQSRANYRELKNLGSRILDVRPFHNEDRTGY